VRAETPATSIPQPAITVHPLYLECWDGRRRRWHFYTPTAAAGWKKDTHSRKSFCFKL